MLPLNAERAPGRLAALAAGYAANPARWPVRPQFDAAERWYRRVAVAPDHEAWLLTWLPGQGTDLHDHGGASGAFHVITGVLTEQTPRYAAPAGLATRRYRSGATRRFGVRHIHRVVNDAPVPAVSLHVYAPALLAMTRYRLDGGRLRPLRVERAGADW
ncbi:hypothetical protein GCM10023322_65460 [Rugosimonospora acidiphila]|uniref:Cysteine dioxygenase type I n=1 Tax=Rugosimonospora acidiphila TaxID=556531 RepID=A0ABP9SIK4_9ACTN